ncbi:MAG: hypothetical protein MI723_03475, partial [Caulobacterales bacterium]|nr:hypothetical protein [Caulobacterales bacterium]
ADPDFSRSINFGDGDDRLIVYDGRFLGYRSLGFRLNESGTQVLRGQDGTDRLTVVANEAPGQLAITIDEVDVNNVNRLTQTSTFEVFEKYGEQPLEIIINADRFDGDLNFSMFGLSDVNFIEGELIVTTAPGAQSAATLEFNDNAFATERSTNVAVGFAGYDVSTRINGVFTLLPDGTIAPGTRVQAATGVAYVNEGETKTWDLGSPTGATSLYFANVEKRGAGRLNLSETNPLASLAVREGEVRADGRIRFDSTTAPVEVSDTGILSGTGNVRVRRNAAKGVSVFNNGALAPGGVGEVGTMLVTEVQEFAGRTLVFESRAGDGAFANTPGRLLVDWDASGADAVDVFRNNAPPGGSTLIQALTIALNDLTGGAITAGAEADVIRSGEFVFGAGETADLGDAAITFTGVPAGLAVGLDVVALSADQNALRLTFADAATSSSLTATRTTQSKQAADLATEAPAGGALAAGAGAA